MAKPKGSKKAGGRVKGTPNKVTVEFREAVNRLLQYAAPEMTEWLKSVAQEDPSKALDHVHRIAEYAHPKLARTELTGKDGGALAVQITDNV